jgi:hypothetical protein
MPVPKHPFSLNGGCNCGSIRYRLKAPQFEERPLSVYCDEHAISEQRRFPLVLIDHCNDCRRATGCLTPIWIATIVSHIEFCIKGDEEQIWIDGIEILNNEDIGTAKNLPLKWYQSSENKFRGFCENCGTSLCYRRTGLKESWPDMVDILLGTVDRVDLEKDWLKPEAELWWDMGIPWIQDLTRQGTIKENMPRHPLWKMNHHVPM